MGTSNKVVYCVGDEAEYTSLLSYLDTNKMFYSFKLCYCGHRIAELANVDVKSVILLNTKIENIAWCIKCSIENITFYFSQHLINPKDEALLNRLNKMYLAQREYKKLKQLNIINFTFDILMKRVVSTSYPIHVQLEHTTFCNARCIMCDHFVAHNRGSRHLSLRTVKSIEKLLPYVSMVIMHGNGEPLINPNILAIMALYEEYQVEVSLNTNLSFLTDEIIKSLKNNCRSLHISCDGVEKEQYESIRIGLSYDRFLNNLHRLETEAPEINRVLEVVLMRQNIINAVDFVRFAYEHGFKKVIFNAIGCNKWIGNENDSLNTVLPLAKRSCNMAKKEGLLLGIEVVTPYEYIEMDKNAECNDIELGVERYPTIDDSNNLYNTFPWYTNTIAVDNVIKEEVSDVLQTTHLKGVCEYPFGKTYIDLEGHVSFCCPASRKAISTLSSNYCFEEIWNSELYQSIRKTFYSGCLPLLCRDCYFMKNNSLQCVEMLKGDGK